MTETRLDDITREVVQELQGEGVERYAETIEAWIKEGGLIAGNYAHVVETSGLLAMAVMVDPNATRAIQTLMYLCFRVGEKVGRGDTMRELMGELK